MIKRIILAPIDLGLFFIGFIIYLITGKTTKRTYFSMIRLFCITKGYSSEFFHYLITLFRKSYVFPTLLKSQLGNFSTNDVKIISNKLKEDGYYIFKNKISIDVVNNLTEFAKNTDAFLRPLKSNGLKIVDRKKNKFNSENPEVIRYDWHASQLLTNKVVQKLISDEVLLSIAQEYFGSAPIVDGVRMWWNTAFSKEPNASASTMYHYDMERLKWLKVFIYLTDVEEENGPHAFIKGSHKVGALPFTLLSKGYVMSEDNEIYKYFNKNDEVIYIAQKGTVIIEDTKGLHKGMPVQSGNRLIFQMQFSDSCFGMDSDAHFPKDISEELKESIDKYPKIFEYYNK